MIDVNASVIKGLTFFQSLIAPATVAKTPTAIKAALANAVKEVARPNIVEPIFLTEHPISLSPLARANDDNKELTDRFQLIINGAEIINAYSELVDPIEQERRLIEQAELKNNGDEEAMMMDQDYINAMEYGMPPISGWGVGIDRLVQILTNAPNIKDCVLFPLMKPEDK